MFIFLYILFKGYRITQSIINKPEPFSSRQRLNLVVIMLVAATAILLPLLHAFFPSNSALTGLAGLDITAISFLGIILCLLLRLAPETDVIRHVPWQTLLLISGMGTLIRLATDTLALETLSGWIAANTRSQTIPYLLSLTSSAMSFFSSTLGVVVPTLSPLAAVASGAYDISPGLLFSVITFPAFFTGFSPFSTAGAIAVSSVADEKERQKLFSSLLVFPIVACLYCIVLLALGIVR